MPPTNDKPPPQAGAKSRSAPGGRAGAIPGKARPTKGSNEPTTHHDTIPRRVPKKAEKELPPSGAGTGKEGKSGAAGRRGKDGPAPGGGSGAGVKEGRKNGDTRVDQPSCSDAGKHPIDPKETGEPRKSGDSSDSNKSKSSSDPAPSSKDSDRSVIKPTYHEPDDVPPSDTAATGRSVTKPATGIKPGEASRSSAPDVTSAGDITSAGTEATPPRAPAITPQRPATERLDILADLAKGQKRHLRDLKRQRQQYSAIAPSRQHLSTSNDTAKSRGALPDSEDDDEATDRIVLEPRDISSAGPSYTVPAAPTTGPPTDPTSSSPPSRKRKTFSDGVSPDATDDTTGASTSASPAMPIATQNKKQRPDAGPPRPIQKVVFSAHPAQPPPSSRARPGTTRPKAARAGDRDAETGRARWAVRADRYGRDDDTPQFNLEESLSGVVGPEGGYGGGGGSGDGEDDEGAGEDDIGGGGDRHPQDGKPDGDGEGRGGGGGGGGGDDSPNSSSGDGSSDDGSEEDNNRPLKSHDKSKPTAPKRTFTLSLTPEPKGDPLDPAALLRQIQSESHAAQSRASFNLNSKPYIPPTTPTRSAALIKSIYDFKFTPIHIPEGLDLNSESDLALARTGWDPINFQRFILKCVVRARNGKYESHEVLQFLRCEYFDKPWRELHAPLEYMARVLERVSWEKQPDFRRSYKLFPERAINNPISIAVNPNALDAHGRPRERCNACEKQQEIYCSMTDVQFCQLYDRITLAPRDDGRPASKVYYLGKDCLKSLDEASALWHMPYTTLAYLENTYFHPARMSPALRALVFAPVMDIDKITELFDDMGRGGGGGRALGGKSLLSQGRGEKRSVALMKNFARRIKAIRRRREEEVQVAWNAEVGG